ncbi:TPR-like protein [Neocallimastix californiae]|uniref:TPR-like protein n=1 Tax=Neocallimastix californiae TaxID=1754190 RepID=A0A1Y2AR45_9FUNG|nr:TPR-like protein [Neocallimastix californiae]|eukprot:ORY24425.1 TPR-like protein [Neocallimastix californiae]
MTSLNMMQNQINVNTEQLWMKFGKVAEHLQEPDQAIKSYEFALRHNPYSIEAKKRLGDLYLSKNKADEAINYYNQILQQEKNSNSKGEIWGMLGHCYLIKDDLKQAYNSYQKALYSLKNPNDPQLWYGIGKMYDRYGSYEHAKNAFLSVLDYDPSFDKANEIYFRLGIIYKEQGDFGKSLECFKYILTSPPSPLTEIDIWFQIGRVYELQKKYPLAKEAFEKVKAVNPTHAKVLQHLGWLYHQPNTDFTNQDEAIRYLNASIQSNSEDAQTYYQLGRCYMAQNKHSEAYKAYQQAVYRDGKDPRFWCSIGVLYFKINQYRDALDAYHKAIQLNPRISEVWFNLGTLYEKCNNQIKDAIDAYQKALEFNPNEIMFKQRIQHLRKIQAQGG